MISLRTIINSQVCSRNGLREEVPLKVSCFVPIRRLFPSCFSPFGCLVSAIRTAQEERARCYKDMVESAACGL